MLDAEIKYFETNQGSLLQKYPGKFVVIKDERLLGPYESIQDALGAGAREFGVTSFLVRRTDQPAAEAVSIPALTLGLLRANSSYTASGSEPDS